MAAILVAAMMMMGMPPLMIFMVMGAAFGGNAGTGIVLHFLTGIIFGAIFGLGVTFLPRFFPTSVRKSAGLGTLYGLVVYGVFFLPIAMLAFAPAMVNLLAMNIAMMNPGMTHAADLTMAQSQAQGLMPSVLGIAFLSHLLFGAVVGLSTYLLVRPALDLEQHAADHAKGHPEGQGGLACEACQVNFRSKEELVAHVHSSHAM